MKRTLSIILAVFMVLSSFATLFTVVVSADETEAEIVDAAFALESGKALEGTKTLTGVVSKIVTYYSAGYNNITVNMTVKNSSNEDKTIQCFRMAGGEDIAVGDTIKVTGSIKNYNGTVEFDTGCTYVLVAAKYAIKHFAGYVSGDVSILVPQEGKATIEAITGKDYNAYALIVVDAKGKVSALDLRGPGRPAGNKGDFALPEEGYVIAINRDVTGYPIKVVSEAFVADGIEVGSRINLVGVDLAALKTAAAGLELTGASFSVRGPLPETEDEIIAAAFALGNGESLEGTYSLTGEVTEIVTAYNSSNKNITVNMKVKGDKIVQCYRMKADSADSPKVGDVITVTGSLKNYKGTVEFDTGCTYTIDGIDGGFLDGVWKDVEWIKVGKDNARWQSDSNNDKGDVFEYDLAIADDGEYLYVGAVSAAENQSSFRFWMNNGNGSVYTHFVDVFSNNTGHAVKYNKSVVRNVGAVLEGSSLEAAAATAGGKVSYEFRIKAADLGIDLTKGFGYFATVTGKTANGANDGVYYPAPAGKTTANMPYRTNGWDFNAEGLYKKESAAHPVGAYLIQTFAGYRSDIADVTIMTRLATGEKTINEVSNKLNSRSATDYNLYKFFTVNKDGEVVEVRPVTSSDKTVAGAVKGDLEIPENGFAIGVRDVEGQDANYLGIFDSVEAGYSVTVYGADPAKLAQIDAQDKYIDNISFDIEGKSLFVGEDWADDWTAAVPGTNAEYQNNNSKPAADAAEKDKLLFDYKYFVKDNKLYVGAKFNQPLTKGTGNGNSSFFRIWLKSNPDASAYTHFFDCYVAADDSIGTRAAVNSSLTENKPTNNADTKYTCNMQEFKGHVEAVMCIPLDEVNATDYLRMFINCAIEKSTGGATGNQCLLVPGLVNAPDAPLHVTNAWTDAQGNVGIKLIDSILYTDAFEGVEPIQVTAENGRWQSPKEADLLTYTLELADDGKDLYVRVVGDGKFAEEISTFRFWIRSNDEATVYTHFYDVDIAEDGKVTNKAKYNTSTTSNSGANIENSGIEFGAKGTSDNKTLIVFKVPLAEFNGANGFAYYAALMKKGVDYSYYPAPEGTDISKMPYKTWDVENEGLYKKEHPVTEKIFDLGEIKPINGITFTPDKADGLTDVHVLISADGKDYYDMNNGGAVAVAEGKVSPNFASRGIFNARYIKVTGTPDVHGTIATVAGDAAKAVNPEGPYTFKNAANDKGYGIKLFESGTVDTNGTKDTAGWNIAGSQLVIANKVANGVYKIIANSVNAWPGGGHADITSAIEGISIADGVITLAENQVALAIMSSGGYVTEGDGEFSNAKHITRGLKTNGFFRIDGEALTLHVSQPDEVVVYEEVPEGAYVINSAQGWRADITVIYTRLATGEKTLGDITAVTTGKAQDCTWWNAILVDKDGKVVKVIGMVDKKAEEIPEGGYMIAAHGSSPILNTLPNIEVGSKITLYNCDLEAFANLKEGKDLVKAAFTVAPPEEDPSVKHPVSYQKSYTTSPNTRTDGWADDGKKLTDGKFTPDGGTNAYAGWSGDLEIVIDLAAKYNVNKFVLQGAYNTGWGIQSLSGFQISYSVDGTNFTSVEATAVKGADEVAGGWTSNIFTMILDAPVEAQYVKFVPVKSAGNFSWISELEVWEAEPDAVIDGKLDEDFWKDVKFTKVDGMTVGTWQNKVSGFTYEYAIKEANGYVTIAVKADKKEMAQLRVWFHTNPEATLYTHFFDVFLDGKDGGLKTNQSLTTNSGSAYDATKLEAAYDADKQIVEARVKLADIGATTLGPNDCNIQFGDGNNLFSRDLLLGNFTIGDKVVNSAYMPWVNWFDGEIPTYAGLIPKTNHWTLTPIGTDYVKYYYVDDALYVVDEAQWPYMTHLYPEDDVQTYDIEGNNLRYNFSITNGTASIRLIFKTADGTVQYMMTNTALGLTTDQYIPSNGDFKATSCSGVISLKDLVESKQLYQNSDFPAAAIQDGKITFAGLEIFAIGGATVVINELAVEPVPADEEPDNYLWMKATKEANPGISIKLSSDKFDADKPLTIKTLVYFGEDCEGTGSAYLNCYPYKGETLLSWVDYASTNVHELGKWHEIVLENYNPAKGEDKPDQLVFGVGFWNKTGTLKVAYIKVLQGEDEILSLTFENGYDLTGASVMTAENKETVWGVVGAKEPQQDIELFVSHLDLYNWATFDIMLTTKNVKTLSNNTNPLDVSKYVMYSVEKIKYQYVVKEFVNDASMNDAVPPEGGFLLFSCVGNRSYDAIKNGELVGLELVLNNFALEGTFAIDTQVSPGSAETITAKTYVPSDEPPAPPAPVVQPKEKEELPDGAIVIDYAGYKHAGVVSIVAGDNQTIAELTARGNNGAAKDMNYAYNILVSKDNVVLDVDFTLAKACEFVCPEGGYIISYNGNKTGYEVMANIKVGDIIKVYNVLIDKVAELEGNVELTQAGFTYGDPPVRPLSYKKTYTVTGNTRTDNFKDDGIKLTDGIMVDNGGTAGSAGLPIADGPSITVDLGGEYAVDKFDLHAFGGNWGITIITGIKVAYSLDGENFTEIDAESTANATGNAWQETLFVVALDAPVKARYVKFTAIGGNYIWADEVEVWESEKAVEVEPFEVTVNVKENEILTDGNTGFDGDWGAVGAKNVLLVANAKCTEAPMVVTIIDEFDAAKRISGYTIDLYHCANVMIGYPEGKAVLSVSADGETWTELGEFDLNAAELVLGKYGTVSTTFEFDAVEAKFVKVVLKVGSNKDVLGDSPAGGKIYWEFISIAEVKAVEAAEELKWGDVNGDGKVNAQDYMLLKRKVLGKATLTPEEKKAMDINKDGKVNAQDYALLKRVVLKTYKPE